jgi:DNA-binding transcriptional regulator YiaG
MPNVKQPEGVMTMSAWAVTVDDQVDSATAVDCTASARSTNTWIGSRVRIKRTSRGLTQHEFSRLLGINRNNLAAYEAGEERVNANLLLRLAKLLEVRPDYFFRGYKEEDWKTA